MKGIAEFLSINVSLIDDISCFCANASSSSEDSEDILSVASEVRCTVPSSSPDGEKGTSIGQALPFEHVEGPVLLILRSSTFQVSQKHHSVPGLVISLVFFWPQRLRLGVGKWTNFFGYQELFFGIPQKLEISRAKCHFWSK